MKPTIEIEVMDEDGNECTHTLPAQYAVCAHCEGHGTHLSPSIRDHAYTREEFEDAFWNEEDRRAYFQRGGKYDVPCERCKGLRVVLVPDEGACTRDPELAEVLDAYHRHREERARWAAEEAMERRYGA